MILSITGTESYGDGWNDAGIEVVIDGVVTETLAMDAADGTTPVAWTVYFRWKLKSPFHLISYQVLGILRSPLRLYI